MQGYPHCKQLQMRIGKLQVRGDVLLARVMDDGDAFQRLDFGLRELSSSAPWVRKAAAQNERKRREDTAATTFGRMGRRGFCLGSGDRKPRMMKRE